MRREAHLVPFEPDSTDRRISVPTRNHRSSVLLAFALILALVSGGCAADPETRAAAGGSTTAAGPAEATFPVEIATAGGTVTVGARPERIVSLSPTATEMLFAIDAGEQVVAVDDQSDFPAEAPVTDLSGFTPNIEAIVGYQPDLVVAANDIDGLAERLDELETPLLILPAATDLDDMYDEIEHLGTATGQVREAAELVESLQSDIDHLVDQLPERDTALTYYHELDTTYFTVTSKTFLGDVYALAGLENIADAADDGSGYPQLSAEQIIAANPDFIFLADTKCCDQSGATVRARPGWDTIRAVTDDHVVGLDDDVASRWGPRVVDLLAIVVDAVTAIPPGAAGPDSEAGAGIGESSG